MTAQTCNCKITAQASFENNLLLSDVKWFSLKPFMLESLLQFSQYFFVKLLSGVLLTYSAKTIAWYFSLWWTLFFSLFPEEICTLVIAETFPEDSGIFTCTATNEHGSVTSSAQLTVCSGMWRRGAFSYKSYIVDLPVKLSVCFLCGKWLL